MIVKYTVIDRGMTKSSLRFSERYFSESKIKNSDYVPKIIQIT